MFTLQNIIHLFSCLFKILPVKKMSQLFCYMCAKPLSDLELIAIMVMVGYNNTVAQNSQV